jgi:hypothetical protein
VVSITVRYKPPSELNKATDGNENRSWALVTFIEVDPASKALRGRVMVDDEEGLPTRLILKPEAVDAQLSANRTKERSKGPPPPPPLPRSHR